MKTKIIIKKNFPLDKDYDAITIGHKIYIRASWYDKATALERKKLIAHEFEHVQQIDEKMEKYGKIGVLVFYILYAGKWVVNMFKYRGNAFKAYWNIDFEKQARKAAGE